LRERSAVEWDELLATTGVPVAPVLTVPQALALDQVAQRSLLHSVPMPSGEAEARSAGSAGPSAPTGASAPGGERSLRVLGSSVHVDGRSVGPAGRPPELGEHVDDVLTEVGYTAEEIADLRARGVV
jgi:crotonobetainyl-CoA:carnitine CoA-transferase CaiB-like acyl-CoA transferase